MKGLMMFVGLITVIFLIAMGSQNIANAGCRAKAYCYLAEEIVQQPMCEDGPYDPCDDWIGYAWEFHRTSQMGSASSIRFAVMEGTTYKWYSQHASGDYGEGDYDGSGSAYVGPSANHSTQIRRASPGNNTGNFEDMSISINYFADDPTK